MGMNRDEFIAVLIEQAPRALRRPVANRMVRQFDDHGGGRSGTYFRNQIGKVLSWIDLFLPLGDEDDQKVLAIWENDYPDIVVASLDLESFIRPIVEAIRLRLFGTVVPRWNISQYPDAIAWIRATEKRASKKISKKQNRRLAELQKQVQDIAREFGEIRGIAPPKFVERLEHLWWIGPDGTLTAARARVDSELGYLAERVQTIADFTGLSHSGVLAHILVGSQLWRAPAKLEVTREGFCQVTFRTPNVTAKQMEKIRLWVKKQWNSDGRKTFSKKDRELMEAVHDRGGLPDSGRNDFWAEIMTELGYESRQGAYKRYKRIQDRLETRRPKLSDIEFR